MCSSNVGGTTFCISGVGLGDSDGSGIVIVRGIENNTIIAAATASPENKSFFVIMGR